jgi:calcineurin-like phosphoesterase family protein
MGNIWFISDTHLNHDKDFIWGARGFGSVEEMNEAIITRWNEVVKCDDIVYHLGDFILGDTESGLKLIKYLNGSIGLIIGNHDTESRIDAFENCHNIRLIAYGDRLKVGKNTLLLSHYPQLTGNFNDRHKVYSIHGHTHSKDAFCEYPLMYNVNCDAHDCRPVALEDMMQEIRNKVRND